MWMRYSANAQYLYREWTQIHTHHTHTTYAQIHTPHIHTPQRCTLASSPWGMMWMRRSSNGCLSIPLFWANVSWRYSGQGNLCSVGWRNSNSSDVTTFRITHYLCGVREQHLIWCLCLHLQEPPMLLQYTMLTRTNGQQKQESGWLLFFLYPHLKLSGFFNTESITTTAQPSSPSHVLTASIFCKLNYLVWRTWWPGGYKAPLPKCTASPKGFHL